MPNKHNDLQSGARNAPQPRNPWMCEHNVHKDNLCRDCLNNDRRDAARYRALRDGIQAILDLDKGNGRTIVPAHQIGAPVRAKLEALLKS